MKKIDELNKKITTGQQKLEEIKKNSEENSKKYNQLVEKQASLQADQIIEFDKKREEEIRKVLEESQILKKDLQSGEAENLIKALEKKIQVLQLEKREEEKILDFTKQKKLGIEIVDLSKKLIEGLDEANSINEKLRETWTLYENFYKNSKKSGIPPGSLTSPGSFGCLKMLLGTLKYEYTSGKPRGNSEFSRIRI